MNWEALSVWYSPEGRDRPCYGYDKFENDRYGNPLILIDKNGRFPVPSPADALDTIKDEWDSKVGSLIEWTEEHEDEIKTGVTCATIAGSAIAAGTGIGIPAAVSVMAIGSTGALMGEQYYEENGMNGADGFMRGGMNATIIAIGLVTNPAKASFGIICQLSTDITQESFSSPESYTGSVIGSIFNPVFNAEGKSILLAPAMATATGRLFELLTVGSTENLGKIFVDMIATTGLGQFANYMVQTVLPWDLAFWFRMALSEETLNWIENIIAGIENAAYGKIWDCFNAD